MAEEETVGLYLVREVEGEGNWRSREFTRVLFSKAEDEWSHRVANADWRPRGRTLPWRDKLDFYAVKMAEYKIKVLELQITEHRSVQEEIAGQRIFDAR